MDDCGVAGETDSHCGEFCGFGACGRILPILVAPKPPASIIHQPAASQEQTMPAQIASILILRTQPSGIRSVDRLARFSQQAYGLCYSCAVG